MTQDYAKEIANHVLKMVHKAKASHVGSALSIVDIVAVLYNDILNVKIKEPNWVDRDRFILSKGHACTALYAALALKGFFSIQELDTYGQDGSDFMNHISHKVPGVEFSTGSLGHGLPFGVGKSLYGKLKNKKWKVFVLLSDGELDEGSNWEALMFAAHHKLDNMVVIIDYNNLQSLDTVNNTLNIEPLHTKLTAFGCYVQDIDGHNHEQIYNTISTSDNLRMPKVIIAHTIKGKRVDFMENKVEWHYKSPSDGELQEALRQINSAGNSRFI